VEEFTLEVSGVPVEDTFAEAFTSWYSRFLITADTLGWAETAAREASGYGCSIIGCSAEAGVEGVLGSALTPDARPGAVVQVWTGRKKMLHELLGRIGQCVLTAPTTAVFDWCDGEEKLDVGVKMRFYADGYESYRGVGGREMVVIPVMMGEFLIERSLGVAKGVAGGNFLVIARDRASALSAAERAARAVACAGGVVSPFPGGVCAAGSKVGSRRFRFMKATTNEVYCPSLRSKLPGSKLPDEAGAVAEIVVNGVSEEAVRAAMKQGIVEACKVQGVLRISAANYGGRLGNVLIDLISLWR